MTGDAPAADHSAIASRTWASERVAGLSGAERALHRRIVLAIAAGARVDADSIGAWAVDVGIESGTGLDALEARDLVHRDARTGSVTVAYPFSAEPTAHQVVMEHGAEAYAMCAIDALGIAFMLDTPVRVESEEPASGVPITVAVDPARASDWSPRSAVVVVGCTGEGTSAQTLCPHTNFAVSRQRGQALLDALPGCAGALLSMPDAIETGCAIFGGLLDGMTEQADADTGSVSGAPPSAR